MRIMILLLAAMCIHGCATAIPSKQVTLVSVGGEYYSGTLVYDSPYSGNLTFPGNAMRESFTGRFTVVDRTSVKNSSADILVPTNGAIPGMGTAKSSETGDIDADGHWVGQGDKGTTMRCNLSMGMQGHGAGKCTASNGKQYDINL